MFVLGMAGFGKSLLTASYSKWLEDQGYDVFVVNMDPGAIKQPYEPDIDVRDYVRVEELMEKYELGPNGALILACDMVANFLEEFRKEIEEAGPNVAIVDTPGQMELFAFRASGPFIVKGISRGPKAVIYLFDGVFSQEPLNFISCQLMAASVYARFLVPQVHVLTKCDLLDKDKVNMIVDWSSKPYLLRKVVEERLEAMEFQFGLDLMAALYKSRLFFPLIPISSSTYEVFDNLSIAIERILSRGEKLDFY
jgi:hypothetical protein